MQLVPDAIVRLNLGRLFLPDLGIQIPVHGFLIKHPGGAGLIDTGYGTNLELIKDFRPVNASIAQALRLHGVEPSDIRWVINSHLHFDHCGQNAVFPHAPVYVQRAEYERRAEPRYTVREWLDYGGAKYELLEGEQQIVPGVRVLTTPGLTPGHQCVRVETTAGPALFTGDACWTVDQFGGRQPREGMMEDPDAFARSLSKLRAVKPASVHFCHDKRTWLQPRVQV